MEHDENVVGVCLWGKEGREAGLVGPSHRHIKTREADSRCRLVTPAKYIAMTTNQEIIIVLNDELLKRKEKYKHFELKFESVNDYKKKTVQVNTRF